MPDHDSCPPSGGAYPSDCDITQGLLKRAAARSHDDERGYAWKACLPKAAKVKLLLLDVDGVLTDGTITYTQDGGEIKSFHTRDGLGLRILQESGVAVGLITARSSEAVSRRANDLGLTLVFQGVKNKLAVFQQILAEQKLSADEVGYVGDDWLDLPLLSRVGFPATVADGARELRNIACYVTRKPGGRGAVREICDLLIEARGMHEELLARYLNP